MPEWISVKDRLPDKNGRYLCCRENSKFISIYSFAKNLRKVDKFDFAEKNRKGWYDYDRDWGHYEVGSVAYWLPLPELPKVGEDKC